jgi:hypothetical protein
MPWVVGIDEAGYGPNLGPLVQAAVALRLPDGDEAGWDTLRPHVRRAAERDDGRVLIDDSKLVHQGKYGLRRLEHGLAATVGLPAGPFADWIRVVGLPGVADDLHAEAWFDPAESVPLHPDPPAVGDFGVTVRAVGKNVVTAPVFNKVVAGSDSKATVLTIGLIELLIAADRALPAGEPVAFYCDKQGGRTFYAPVLAAAFPAGWVVTERETPDESRYRVEYLGRPVRVVFRPRADAGSVAVALASMVCKYTREVCMRQFNRFWAGHVPGLKPTAGYPGDAGRYLESIRPAMARLGLPEAAVWRCR